MDYNTLNSILSQKMNLQEPYAVQTMFSHYSDNLEVRFINKHSKFDGKPMYMVVTIPMHTIRANVNHAFDSMDYHFERFKRETGIVMDFSPLDHILKHVNGHPLKNKITF